LLIRHSEYSAMLSKIHSYSCFFDDFDHWVRYIRELLPDLFGVFALSFLLSPKIAKPIKY